MKPKLTIKAAAILNEDNPELFSELMKKGIDAVELEIKKRLKKKEKKKIKEILDENNKIAGNLFKGSNVRFEYINNRTIKVFKHSYPYDFVGYVELRILLSGYCWGYSFYKKDFNSYRDKCGLDNYQLQAVAKICEKLNSEKADE